MRDLGVDKYIIAGAADVCRGSGVLCDVGEAIIAAIYMDSGCMETAQDFIRRNWGNLIDRSSHARKDYKTFLQEKAAQMKLPTPMYRLLKQEGPAHAPNFVVCVMFGDKHYTEGAGASKKKAEQQAAAKMIQELGIEDV